MTDFPVIWCSDLCVLWLSVCHSRFNNAIYREITLTPYYSFFPLPSPLFTCSLSMYESTLYTLPREGIKTIKRYTHTSAAGIPSVFYTLT